jgi:hypothetical protein
MKRMFVQNPDRGIDVRVTVYESRSGFTGFLRRNYPHECVTSRIAGVCMIYPGRDGCVPIDIALHSTDSHVIVHECSHAADFLYRNLKPRKRLVGIDPGEFKAYITSGLSDIVSAWVRNSFVLPDNDCPEWQLRFVYLDCAFRKETELRKT